MLTVHLRFSCSDRSPSNMHTKTKRRAPFIHKVIHSNKLQEDPCKPKPVKKIKAL